MKLFGIEIKRANDKEELRSIDIEHDGSASVIEFPENTSVSGIINGLETFSANDRNPDEVRKLETYRKLAEVSEIDEALTEIYNEVFIFDIPEKRAFGIDFMNTHDAPSESLKKKIQEQFEYLYDICDFHDKGIEYFQNWYVDGRIYFQLIVNKNGIRRIQRLEPLNLRKIKIVPRNTQDGTIDQNKIEEFYIYGRQLDKKYKFGQSTVLQSMSIPQNVLKILPDAISYSTSGKTNMDGLIVGHLDKAIVPYNNLKMMEDSMVIFRVVRAPQRRVFYVDVGSLQKNKADSYMKEMMARFRNRMVYDASTGSIADRKNIMSMVEDIWLPRRENRSTEVTTLDGQDVSGILEEVEYYRDKLWRSLNVPRTRFGENQSSFIFGRGAEIQRDEYRFKKFLDRLRKDFLKWFEDCLKKQLILKNIISANEWEMINRSMYWTFAEDNAFVEYKESEILNNRINTLQAINEYAGKYYSHQWIRKNVLRQTDEEMRIEDELMAKERKDGEYDSQSEGVPGDWNPFPGNRDIRPDNDSERQVDREGEEESSSTVTRKKTVVGISS